MKKILMFIIFVNLCLANDFMKHCFNDPNFLFDELQFCKSQDEMIKKDRNASKIRDCKIAKAIKVDFYYEILTCIKQELKTKEQIAQFAKPKEIDRINAYVNDNNKTMFLNLFKIYSPQMKAINWGSESYIKNFNSKLKF